MKREKRSQFLQFRVTPSEFEKILGWAEDSDMVVYEYLRRVVMMGVTFRIEKNSQPVANLGKVDSIDVREEEVEDQPRQKIRKNATG